MCQHRSYIVTEDYKVLADRKTDSHTSIREFHHIRDDMHETIPHVSVECFPTSDLFNCMAWRFIIDGTKPGPKRNYCNRKTLPFPNFEGKKEN